MLKTGDVIELPAGLHCFHNQASEMTVLKVPTMVVVETTRELEPMAVTGVDAHFEKCLMLKARALNVDGTYHPEGALLTVAEAGDFRPEFVIPQPNKTVLRRMKKVFITP